VKPVGSYAVMRFDREKIDAWPVYALYALVATCLILLLAPAAGATVTSFTWTGGATAGTPGWASGANWEGGSAPSSSEPVSLEFPKLTSSACSPSPPSDTCYVGENNTGDLTVESLRMDDGDEYTIKGDEVTLGDGGLTASPADGTSGLAGDVLELPIRLSAAQAWNITGREGGTVGENGVFVGDGLTGPGKALAIDMSDGPVLYLEGDSEVGPIAIDGTAAGVAGGLVRASGELNGTDEDPVNLSDVKFEGGGTVGALSVSATELVPAGRLEAASTTFDSSSKAVFEFAGSYNSELTSHGTIELGNSSIGFASVTACPEVTVGHVYTLTDTSALI
jgi:hypothetical protein